MPIRDKTITNDTVRVNELYDRLYELDIKVDNLSSGIIPMGIYPTYEDAMTDLATPEDGWMIIIENDENHSDSQTQYFYYENDWVFLGGVSSVNDASSTVKGVVRLSGDLSGNANNPQLNNVFPDAGNYSVGGSVFTFDTKGRCLNINITQISNWVYSSMANERTESTDTFVVPQYDINNSEIWVFWNGGYLLEDRDWERVDDTTIKTHFNVAPEDDVVIFNTKYQGIIDVDSLNNKFAKIDDDIIPTMNREFDIGTTDMEYKDIYIYNSPIVTSSRLEKKDIEDIRLGLDFINDLQPRTYKMIDGKRNHMGLIADEVKTTMDLYDIDFGVYISDGKTKEALRYEELIPVLCQAIKQLTPWYKKIYYWIKHKIRQSKVGE